VNNSQIESAINDLFDKLFIRGFKVLAIHRQTGLGESEIEDYLNHLVDIGRLTVEWEIPCKNCMTMLAKYHEKPESINETFCCSRCGTDWTLDVDDLQKTYFRGIK
jgi:hypothetical protein